MAHQNGASPFPIERGHHAFRRMSDQTDAIRGRCLRTTSVGYRQRLMRIQLRQRTSRREMPITLEREFAQLAHRGTLLKIH